MTMASKVNFKISKSEAAYIEHYFYGILAAGLAAHEIAPHDSLKVVAGKAVVGGLLAPILARVNPKSLFNQIDEVTGAPATLTAPIVTAALADAQKIVATEATK